MQSSDQKVSVHPSHSFCRDTHNDKISPSSLTYAGQSIFRTTFTLFTFLDVPAVTGLQETLFSSSAQFVKNASQSRRGKFLVALAHIERSITSRTEMHPKHCSRR